ncbi:RHS repeat-associated core domain-containing protein, partial [Escherichia marmotae]|nr:RHS repeat-associated core domain-containing protein [Escherichia marmotae]
ITGRGESRKIWYYHTDVTGTVQEVSAADGTLVWAGYQAGFGENRGDISNSGAYFEQPLRLPGQYFDEETGLHYNLFRYYAPECGRFISQDPIGLRGGLNLYAYAPNPLSWIDPLGLFGCGPKAQQHILHGDGPGSGGHMWLGQPGKTTFPQSWDAKKIISEVDDIVNSPSTKWYAQQGTGGALTKAGKAANWVAWEVRDGVQIRVVFQPAKGRIVTAFPDSGPIPPLPGAK